MQTWEKFVKYVLIVLLVVGGAGICYVAGLGTGLYAVQLPQLAAATATPLPTLAEVPPSPTPIYTLHPPLPATPLPATPLPATPLPATPTASPVPPTVPPPTVRPVETAPADFGIFWEAWQILQDEFYGDLPDESELPYAAIRGVIATAGDEYTAFLDPIQAEIVRSDMNGSFEGIGATIRLRPDGKFEVVQPLAGYPAIQAGMRAKDVILEVDGQRLDGMTIYEAISLIRGPAGTIVSLLIEREGVDAPFIVEIERARIELPVLESKTLREDVAYIRLAEFGQTATAKLTDALRDLEKQNPRGLILDLRGNPGGFLNVSIQVASQFISEGPILIERFKDGREQSYEAIPGGLALEIPLVVLVDGGSASASEIVAGAIQDTGRGVLIGTKTLGKGSVQQVHTLSDDSQLRVTVARWFTPNGRAIHGEGLVPDIEVEISEEDLQAERDPQLERAIVYILEGK